MSRFLLHGCVFFVFVFVFLPDYLWKIPVSILPLPEMKRKTEKNINRFFFPVFGLKENDCLVAKASIGNAAFIFALMLNF